MSNQARFEVYPQMHSRRGSFGGPLILEPTGEFGWRFRAGNGDITAVGGEGFTRPQDAHRAIKEFLTDVGSYLPAGSIGSWPVPIIKITEEAMPESVEVNACDVAADPE